MSRDPRSSQLDAGARVLAGRPLARYQAQAISALEMIQELAGLAKEVKQSRQRKDALGLSPEKVALLRRARR